MTPRLLPATGALVAAIGIAACGSSSSHSSSPAAAGKTAAAGKSAASGHELTISAPKSGALMFSTKTLHTSAGEVTIAFTNDAPEVHNFTLATKSGKVLAATPQFRGGTKTVMADLKAGTYTYYCDVPGHEAAGMKGTLTVS